MTAWTDEAFAARHWPDAESLDVPSLLELLDAATSQVSAYAPTPAPDPIPVAWQLAVVFHARELYGAEQREGSSDLIGVGDYVIRARPLTGAVKGLVRPQDPVPRFGGAV